MVLYLQEKRTKRKWCGCYPTWICVSMPPIRMQLQRRTNICAACEMVGVPRYRLLRASSPIDDAIVVENCAAAAAFLQTKSGNILLTIGSKLLSSFSCLDSRRLFVRVLPTHESLTACESMGLPHKNILALQGPFTKKMNEAMLEQYHIAWMVTKDSGDPGGISEKIAAARQAGVRSGSDFQTSRHRTKPGRDITCS